MPGPYLDAVLKEKSCPVQICASAGRDVGGCSLSHKKCHISQGTVSRLVFTRFATS